MLALVSKLIGITLVLCSLATAVDFSFDRGTIPTSFTAQQSYPNRDEDVECRPIRVRIARNSFRFTRDLRVNYNNKLTFQTSDARRMTSRCQSRLDALANSYQKRFKRKLQVLLGWVNYDPSSTIDISNTSLHYEGRSVRVRGYLNTISHNSKILLMAIEAGFDWVYLESEFSVRLSVVPDLCRINMDLVWILDQSGSVGRSNHGLALQFINNVHNFFEIGLDRTRVGMVTYSTRSRIAFDLNDHTSRNSLRRAVNAIRYPGGYTRTAQALAYARFLFNDNNNRGVRPVMDGIPRVAVLITDGKSNLQPLGQEPQKLKDSGVVVYSVGIGNIDLDELLEISSDPDQLYVYLLRRYSDASNFVDLLGATLCESPAIVITGSFVLTRVGRAEFKYFQTICGQFTRNTTIIVEVRDRIGFSFVYVSTAIPNPGPVSPRPYTVANTNAAFKRTRRLITVRFHAEFTFTRTVYISVEGTENTNEFELTVYEMLFNPDILEVTVTGNSPPPNPIINVRDYLNATGSFRFSITEGNEAGRFTVDESTGEIRAKAPLNPAEGLLYNLTVVAENTQDMCQRSRAYVVIMVTAGNDNTPVFQPLTPVSIPETTPNDVSVAVVTATDADAGTSGQVTYSIESGNTNSVFNIHEDSGVISVSQNQFLNRSMYQAQYMLGIVARDGGDPQQSAMATQTVNVQDVNEPPFFTTPCARNSTCVYMVSEGASPTDVIGDVMADDVDPGTNGEVTYSITRSSGSIGLFNVNNEGRIIVGQELNFDGEETTFLVEITVRDGGNPSLSAVTEVTIEITDVNDNPPTITVTSPVSILESATGLVATVVADDPDTVGGPIQFSLTGSSLFRIDISSGEITLTGPLDYETQTQHTVTVTATDGGGMSSSAVIVFNVIDENDNSPIFYGNPYQFMLTEEQVLTDFGSVFANDSDSGSNAQIKYSIQTSSTPFTVDQQSGSLSSSALDRESTDFHDLIVVATDCGTPPRSSQAVVRVTVLDINDNPPTFQRSTYHREYREDISVPRDVVVVMATDRDQPNTDNSRFVYSVSPSNNFFDVDQTTGQVRLVLPLDYEAQQVHNVTIVATDMGQPPMNGSAVVIVTVLDVNDNIPSIVDSLTVNISELAQPGTRIAQFTATDVDANSVLTYSIVSGNDDNLFTVNTTSGLVSLLTMLDYETQQMHRLNVSVKDQGGQGAFGTLVVNVINENDNTPEISAVATFDVDEETPVSTSLFTVTASDADLPPYNSITFSISSSPLAGAFSISDDGNVTIATVIDRENLRRLNPNDEITVVIVASDGELSSMATVTIRVQDINDNPPIFTVHSSSLEFNEEQMSGTTLTTLTATDADIGLNAQVVYSIQGDIGLPFVIGNTSGVVMATRPLDREAGDVQFMFSVVAMDRGSPSLSAITNITVQVVDINDNRPLFNQTLHQVTIPENTPTGQTVVRLFAEDADQGSNGEFEYRILSGNQDSTFNISDSGIFKTNRELDFERRQFYAVTIAAVDMGTPALTGTAVVEVTVENIDESPPGAFGPCTRTLDEFTVPEGGRVPIIDCPATDFDDGRVTANPVTYAIVEVNGDRVELNHPFTLDRRTSLLSAVRDIDFEAESNWTLLISATDSSDNVAFTYIYVIVRDINDNVPTFINGPFRAFYRSVAQTNIFLLEAEDLDTGLNGLFEIYRVGFSQRGNTSVYDVTFNATDFGTPRLTGTVNLEVNIDPDLHPCLFVNFTVDHAPNTTRGFVRIQTLCSFTTQPSSANLILGQNHTFMCAAQGNLDISYRWIHNGSAITSPSPSGELALSGIEFQEAGQYACVASSSIGSLQSGTVTAIILVAPVILNAPTSVSVELDRMVRFWCVSEGNPDPTNAFTHTRRFVNTNIMNGQDGGRILVTQNFMLISSVVEEDDGDYRCTASSIAGTVTSEPAHLFIFGISNLISITVEEIQSPDSVGQCQAFNPNTFADSANQASGNQLEMHIINSTGDNICNQSACSPNPCLNGGACIESNITGFTCNCLDGWEGTTCQTDIDECVTRDPCLFDGNCTNTNGSFTCSCPPGHFGPTCKYRAVCNDTLCSEGKVCLETVVMATGYDCVDNTTSRAIVVTGLPGVTTGDLDGTIELNNLEDPVPFASTTTRRRRRQTSDDLRCEVRTRPIDGRQFQLFFACPVGATPPNATSFMEVCQLLIANKKIADCQFPDGSMFAMPEPVQLDPARITISFIVTDPRSNLALPAEQGVEELETFGVLDELKGLGYRVLNPEPAQVATGPPPGTTQPSDNQHVPTIIGIVVGVLGAIAIVLGIVGVVICCCTSRSSGKLVMSSATAKRRMSVIARPKSMFSQNTLDRGTPGKYTVNDCGLEHQNPTFVNDWTNGNENEWTNGNGNGFEDSETAGDSLKNRIDEVVSTTTPPPPYPTQPQDPQTPSDCPAVHSTSEKPTGIRKVAMEKKGKKLERGVVDSTNATPSQGNGSTSTSDVTTNWE